MYVDTMNATGENNVKEVAKCLKRAFALVGEGLKGLELHDDRKNVTMLLGPTGTGKSTFAQLVFTDAENVTAEEMAGGDFKIEDGDVKIGDSLINSKTISPDFYEKVWETKIVVNACDFGGFGDTRDVSHDLAVNCLIKTVADFADSVKMVFFISHPSVRKGVDRTNFMNLLRRITDLVKDINKFRNGIALIVTKVDNITTKKGGQYVLVDDETVIHAIADFLIQVKQELKTNLSNDVGDDEYYKKNAIIIIDILLTQNNESFPKIKLFRRPDERGPLKTSALCQNLKRSFLEIFHSIDYIVKNGEDFQYALSEKSLNGTNEIVEECNLIIFSNLKEIAHIVQEYFCCIQKNIYGTIGSIMTGTTDAKNHQIEAKKLVSEFRNAMYVIEKLVNEVKRVTEIEKAVGNVLESISILGINIPTDIITDLMNQVKYLDFLQTICKREFCQGPYDGIFNAILLFSQDLNKHFKEHVHNCVKKTEVLLKDTLKGLTREIEADYFKKMQTLSIDDMLSMLNKEKLIISAMIETISSVAGTKERIEYFCNLESDLSISFPVDIRDSIWNLKERFLYFENISDKEINIDLSSHLILTLQAVHKLINQKLESWYTFLIALHAKFSEYSIQRVIQVYNVKNLEDWGRSNAENGICINPDNYKLFLDKVSTFSLAECNSVKNLQLTESRQQELNHVLSLTLKSGIKIDCTEKSVAIRGDYISLKSLFNNEHNVHFNGSNDNLSTMLRNSKIKTVFFFAFHTIFIDQDLDFVGRKMTLVLISPNWEIIGTRKIDLSGKDGDEPPANYPETNSDYKKANDGVPGKPGGPGGNFYGIGVTFKNGENLTIFANGGKGGAGQKGQNGRNGEDAVITSLNDVFNRFPSLPSWVERTLDIFGDLPRSSAPFVSREAVVTQRKGNAFEVDLSQNGGMEGQLRNSANTLNDEQIDLEATYEVINDHGEPEDAGAGSTDEQSGRKGMVGRADRSVSRMTTPFISREVTRVEEKISSEQVGCGATNVLDNSCGEPEDDGAGSTDEQSGRKWMRRVGRSAYSVFRKTTSFLSRGVTRVEEMPLQRNQIVLEVSKEGDDGGNGGKGGHGGNPGKILIREFSGQGVTVVFVNNYGEPGANGAGGTAGQSGKKKVLSGSEREGIIVELVEGGFPGENGSDGSNICNLEVPEPAQISTDFSLVKKKYENLLRIQMADRFREHHAKEFMVYLNNKEFMAYLNNKEFMAYLNKNY